eukprot:1180937-Prorocentrum_minimum.AAC.2
MAGHATTHTASWYGRSSSGGRSSGRGSSFCSELEVELPSSGVSGVGPEEDALLLTANRNLAGRRSRAQVFLKALCGGRCMEELFQDPASGSRLASVSCRYVAGIGLSGSVFDALSCEDK